MSTISYKTSQDSKHYYIFFTVYFNTTSLELHIQTPKEDNSIPHEPTNYEDSDCPDYITHQFEDPLIHPLMDNHQSLEGQDPSPDPNSLSSESFFVHYTI